MCNKQTEDNGKGIPISVIKRLPIYYRYLNKIEESSNERISSKELAEKLCLTASQIRQDLNHFGNFGQRGYGYCVKSLKIAIGEILGINNKINMVLVGAGNLGNAIANYSNFRKRGFFIKAIFDSAPEKVDRSIAGCTVMNIAYLEEYLKSNFIDIGVLAIPTDHALKIAKVFKRCHVKGIWNFAPVSLNLEDILVENVHISESLMTLAYQIKEGK